jgi:hypothetical protein
MVNLGCWGSALFILTAVLGSQHDLSPNSKKDWMGEVFSIGSIRSNSLQLSHPSNRFP